MNHKRGVQRHTESYTLIQHHRDVWYRGESWKNTLLMNQMQLFNEHQRLLLVVGYFGTREGKKTVNTAEHEYTFLGIKRNVLFH